MLKAASVRIKYIRIVLTFSFRLSPPPTYKAETNDDNKKKLFLGLEANLVVFPVTVMTHTHTHHQSWGSINCGVIILWFSFLSVLLPSLRHEKGGLI